MKSWSIPLTSTFNPKKEKYSNFFHPSRKLSFCLCIGNEQKRIVLVQVSGIIISYYIKKLWKFLQWTFHFFNFNFNSFHQSPVRWIKLTMEYCSNCKMNIVKKYIWNSNWCSLQSHYIHFFHLSIQVSAVSGYSSFLFIHRQFPVNHHFECFYRANNVNQTETELLLPLLRILMSQQTSLMTRPKEEL